MPLYEVYHRKNVDATALLGRLPEQAVTEDYEKVATVRAVDLEEVFELTNHISDAIPWWAHSRVTPVVPHPSYRSTSVGDVVAGAGQVWMVAPTGFVQVTWGQKVEDASHP